MYGERVGYMNDNRISEFWHGRTPYSS